MKRKRSRNVLGTTNKGPELLLSPTTTPPSLPLLTTLPDDIILDILLWLPVRSLLQSRSVCKSWKTLISSPQFAKDHLQRSIANPSLTLPQLARLEFPKCETYPAQFMIKNPSALARGHCTERVRYLFDIVGFCNGLLCLRDILHNSVRLWNPCTGLTSEWLQIENLKRTSVTFRGFGYDHVHDKYKLLVVLKGRLDQAVVTKVYTFGSNSWTTIQNSPCTLDYLWGKCVNGTLNWIGWKAVDADPLVIVSLDLGKETFDQLSLPVTDDDKLSNPVLHVLRNCLCVCYDVKTYPCCEMWMMKEYGVKKSWTKLVIIYDVELYDYRICVPLEPLYKSETDPDMNVVLVRYIPDKPKFVLHNSNDHWFGPRPGKGEDVYHESLVSPSHVIDG